MLVLLAGCGGARPAPPTDEALEVALESGADAMTLARFPDAARAYAGAYDRALARDDAASLATAGVGRAIALERDGRPAAALDAAERTRIDLARRRTPSPALLDLAEAAALLQLGRASDAARLAAPAEQSADVPTRERALFLEGLAADALGDRTTLAACLERVETDAGKRPDDTERADRAELAARLALASGNATTALAEARHAVDFRRTALDYRGMRRALRLAAVAAGRQGDQVEAAELTADATASARAGAPSERPAADRQR